MIQKILPGIFLTLLFAFTSCSETDNEVEEFADWQNKNEAFFNSLYSTTKAKIAAGDKSWKIIKSWSIPADKETFISSADDYIIVEVLEEGTGSGCPIFTDQVWTHYQGRLLPSASYANGYIFDQSYYGEFNEMTATPVNFSVNSLVDGFSTALQNMHIGDYWRVYIPYQLGYGEKSSSETIPDCSTLIFEIRLVAYARQGAEVPIND